MMADNTLPNRGWAKPLGYALVANFVWINLSEVFRYFAFIMPMMRQAFPELPDVAPMNLEVFLAWGLWDTVLVFAATVIPWVVLERFGNAAAHAFGAGVIVWMTVFVILWFGLFNMNLATGAILAIALPLALIEMVIAAFIVRWCRLRF